MTDANMTTLQSVSSLGIHKYLYSIQYVFNRLQKRSFYKCCDFLKSSFDKRLVTFIYSFYDKCVLEGVLFKKDHLSPVIQELEKIISMCSSSKNPNSNFALLE